VNVIKTTKRCKVVKKEWHVSYSSVGMLLTKYDSKALPLSQVLLCNSL